MEPLKELGLASHRVEKLPSKLHVHSVSYAAKLVHTRRALSLQQCLPYRLSSGNSLRPEPLFLSMWWRT